MAALSAAASSLRAERGDATDDVAPEGRQTRAARGLNTPRRPASPLGLDLRWDSSRRHISSPVRGLSFRTGRPVVVPDLRGVEGLDLPGIYAWHGIVASANVPFAGEGDRPFGVLEVDAREPRPFGRDDLGFLRNRAKVMATAIRALRRDAAVRAESEAEAALLQEQQHRVRNNPLAATAMLRRGATAQGRSAPACATAERGEAVPQWGRSARRSGRVSVRARRHRPPNPRHPRA